MGAKAVYKVIIFGAASLILALGTLTVNALTAEELYQQLDIPYTSSYADTDLQIINDYNYAKRYVTMFRYVSSANPNTAILDRRIAALDADIKATEKEMLLGFDKSMDEIYELEAEYQTDTIRLAEALTSKISVDKDFSHIEVDDIPTYAEYLKAVQNKQLADIQSNLGTSDLRVAPNTNVIYDYTEDSVTYGTTENAYVVSIFNGVVIYTKDDVVTIDHHNGIVSSYKGLMPTVSIGDTVYQGGVIGKSSGKFTAKLRVAGELVDIYKLLEE